MKTTPKARVVLLIVGLAVLLVALGLLLILPKTGQLNDLASQEQAAEQQVALAKTKLAQRQAIKNRAADTNAKWMELASLVPSTSDMPSLIINLQDAAFSSGVQLIGVTPSSPASPTVESNTGSATASTATTGTPEPGYTIIPVQVEILGTWADTVNYIQRIQNFSRGLRVVEIVSSMTDNNAQTSKENETLPDYFEMTTIKLEVYVIADSSPQTDTSSASGTGN
ncbi:MAG: type 4a pilus biogenesis protein PilO [Coriobacteriia bacterium]